MVAAQPLGLLVEMVQDLVGRQIETGQGLHDGAQLAHDRGGGHGVAHDVADDQRDAVAGKRDRVVPVAADLGGLRGGQVAAGQPDPGGLGQRRREHGVLERVRHGGLVAVHHRLLDPECGVRGQL